MANQQQSSSTPGTAESNEAAPRAPKPDPERTGSAPSDPGSSGGSQDRPGSDPKNPGDFGHH
jgi:hypothetical protein